MEHWPQYTYLVLMFLGLLVSIHEHGKPRSNGNAFSFVIGTAIGASLLIAGGFFKGVF